MIPARLRRAAAVLCAVQLVVGAVALTLVHDGPAASARVVTAAPTPVATATTTPAPTTAASQAATTPMATAPRTTRPPAPPRPTTTARPLTFSERIARALAPAPASCLVADGPAGAVVSLGVDRPLAAASVQKLLVGAAALNALGPDFRFRTMAVSAAPPVNGALDRLWLVGAGDPVLATPAFAGQLSTRPRYGFLPLTPLDELAARVAGAGVRTVTNGVTPDDSRYSRERRLPVWTKEQEPEKNVGALGALVVDGGWKPGSKPWVTDPGDPSVTTANAFTQLLATHDVSAPAANGQGGTPTTAFTVASIDSAPLANIVAAMLRTSDNFTAEELVRELGARFGGAGTHDAGLAVIRDQLTKLGVPLDGVTLVDGSGMSFGDRATCRSVATALALGSRPAFNGLADGLAVPGAPGTLSKRYVGTPLASRLRAKTGSIKRVQALAGTLAAGVPLRFVLLQNAVSSDTASSVERNVLDVLLTAS